MSLFGNPVTATPPAPAATPVSPAVGGKDRKGKKKGGKRSENTSGAPPTDKKLITQAAVKVSLTGGAFIDTKFYAYSRKRSSGVVDTPQAVYASSAILKATSKYFDGCKYR